MAAVTGESALQVLDPAPAQSGTSLLPTIGSKSTITSKPKKIKEIEEPGLENEILDLMESLKPGEEEGEPSGSCDDDDDDTKQQGLNLSHSVESLCDLPKANIFGKIMANNALLAESVSVLQQTLLLMSKEGGRNVGESVGKKETSKTLKAKALWSTAEEKEEELQKTREAAQKLDRIKLIIKNKKRSSAEKEELIDYVIKKTEDDVFQLWLIENQNSEVFFKLVDLWYFIKKKVDEEEKKKNREKKKKIDLIFVAHGRITDEMIPARCLLPLPSIKDVILYPPWNCLLTVNAAYAIATGRIEPHHRRFYCEFTENWQFTSSNFFFYYNQKLSPQLDKWNSMKDSKGIDIPVIMVSPVGQPEDKAFPAFLSLEEEFGEPGAGRYVIPYLATDIGPVPFHAVTLALSLVLDSYKYEARVHLAACLEKYPTDPKLKEYLKQQYCYTESRIGMDVTPDAIVERNDELFNIINTVFGKGFHTLVAEPEPEYEPVQTSLN